MYILIKKNNRVHLIESKGLVSTHLLFNRENFFFSYKIFKRLEHGKQTDQNKAKAWT